MNAILKDYIANKPLKNSADQCLFKFLTVHYPPATELPVQRPMLRAGQLRARDTVKTCDGNECIDR